MNCVPVEGLSVDLKEYSSFSWVHTFPWATSSLCAAEAAFTRALVAAAMDLAASKICSSKFKLSSASCLQERETKHQ